MFLVSRMKNESIVLGDDIILTVIEIRGDKVRLGVEHPKGVIPSPENSRAPVPRIVSIGQDRLGVGITPGA